MFYAYLPSIRWEFREAFTIHAFRFEFLGICSENCRITTHGGKHADKRRFWWNEILAPKNDAFRRWVNGFQSKGRGCRLETERLSQNSLEIW